MDRKKKKKKNRVRRSDCVKKQTHWGYRNQVYS